MIMGEMDMNNNLLQQIEKYKIVPVVKVERAGDTGRLCEARHRRTSCGRDNVSYTGSQGSL